VNRHTLPRAVFAVVLVAGAAAVQTAAALPPVRAEVVDDATLAGISGKYYGANMLVGLRIDVVSTLHTAQQGSAQASGSVVIRRNGSGFDVSVGTQAQTGAGDDAAPATGTASGGERLLIDGIGQITQIAGDGNQLSNLTSIQFVSDLDGGGDLNGVASSESSAGSMTARITFTDGGLQLDLTGPGSVLGQQFRRGADGADGRLLQIGQLTGNGISASNQLHLQLMTQLMPSLFQQQLGVQQALAGLRGLSR
jgi:hypothetical protein